MTHMSRAVPFFISFYMVIKNYSSTSLITEKQVYHSIFSMSIAFFSVFQKYSYLAYFYAYCIS